MTRKSRRLINNYEWKEKEMRHVWTELTQRAQYSKHISSYRPLAFVFVWIMESVTVEIFRLIIKKRVENG